MSIKNTSQTSCVCVCGEARKNFGGSRSPSPLSPPTPPVHDPPSQKAIFLSARALLGNFLEWRAPRLRKAPPASATIIQSQERLRKLFDCIRSKLSGLARALLDGKSFLLNHYSIPTIKSLIKMKTFFSLALLLSVVRADVYLHNPR